MARPQRKNHRESAENVVLTWSGVALVLLGTLIAFLAYRHSIRDSREEDHRQQQASTLQVERLLNEAGSLLGEGGAFPSVPFSQSMNNSHPSDADLRTAKEKIDEALLLSPDNRRARILETFYFSSIGRDDIAVAKTRLLLEDSGTPDPTLLTNLGGYLTAQGEYAEAEAVLNTAVEIAPDYGPAYNSLGQVQLVAGRPRVAIETFTALLELDERFLPAYNGLGAAWLALGKPQQAEEALRSAIRSDPNYSPAQLNLGLLLLQRGDFESATTFLRSVCEIRPEDPSAWFHLAGGQYGIGDYEGALASYQKAAELAPLDPYHQLGIGFSFLRMRSFRQALTAFRAAQAIDPRTKSLLTERARELDQLLSVVDNNSENEDLQQLRSLIHHP